MFSRLVKAALGLFRSSLQIRALVYTVALSGSALVLLGGVLSVSIGNGLFSTRTDHALEESQRAQKAVARIFEGFDGSSTWELNQAIDRVVPELESRVVSQTRSVAFTNTFNRSNSWKLKNRASESFDKNLIGEDFKESVLASNELQSQTVQIVRDGDSVPAVLTGQKIVLPGKHEFLLFLIYDMYNEQQTLAFVQGTLVLGGFVTLCIIGFFSFLVTSWLVRPVQDAAEASELIASGDLSRRLPVRGSDVVAVLATSFNHMADSLQEKIRALGELSNMQQRFVSDVSHELRTPLTTLRLSADFLYSNREILPENTVRTVEILHDQMDRFDKLLIDLLEISRYDAAGVKPEFEVQDLNGLVGSSLAAIQQFADSKGVYLDAEIPVGPVQCEVDSRRIERILNNLLTNAIEHSEGKPVKIRVGQNTQAVAVTVTDNGIGMNHEELTQVFGRFWRADPSRKRTTGGTGLGLAISIEDAHLHNGLLEVTAEPGLGACFRLTIPKRQDVADFVSPLPLAVEKLI
ncbi:MAG: sensor histidine kinase [Microbacteriaceae bacterium]|nr:sensor histidine kinase [Microbacteriaceae bacterium]